MELKRLIHVVFSYISDSYETTTKNYDFTATSCTDIHTVMSPLYIIYTDISMYISNNNSHYSFIVKCQLPVCILTTYVSNSCTG